MDFCSEYPQDFTWSGKSLPRSRAPISGLRRLGRVRGVAVLSLLRVDCSELIFGCHSVKIQAAAILEPALLPQRLKLVVLLYRLLRHVTRFGFMRYLGPPFILRLFLQFLLSTMPWLDFSFCIAHLFLGTKQKAVSDSIGTLGFFPGFCTHS